MKFLIGILSHVVCLMTYTHRGAGLPKARGAVHLILIAIAFGLSYLRWTVVDLPGLKIVINFAINYGLAAVLMGPAGFAVVLLACIGTDAAACLAYVAGLDLTTSVARFSLMAWELSATGAGIVFAARHLKQQSTS